ncbi:MAG: dolichyl-phosphate-mannose-protein mannosyltransferase [Symploca sp. SIO2E6]|nr:dolichyl-phosphate-mannose-protein mannosyltransferase [Symploca sp. SIO2E6]
MGIRRRKKSISTHHSLLITHYSLLITVLVLGIFFRFVNLEHKVYWHDEVYTSIRIAGYTGDEVGREIFTDQVVGTQELQKYQQLSRDKGLDNTIKALAGHPEHPPLYYLIARFWEQLFGSSVAVIRSLSAIISLLAFPSIYWLCWELSKLTLPGESLIDSNSVGQYYSDKLTPSLPNPPIPPSLVGWIAIALLSISPFHVLYAQEARQYSLWTVTILLTNAALIRAMRLKNNSSWVVYATTLILGLYTSLFSVLGVIGQGIYVVTVENFRWTKTLKTYLIASLVAMITFAPWLLLIITKWQSLQENTTWTKASISPLLLIGCWFLNLNSIFIDLFFSSHHPLTYIVPPILFILVAYAIYFLCRHTPQPVWLLILTMILANTLPLILPDLIFGGQRSASTRYFIPCFLGIQLAVAYLFAYLAVGRRQNPPLTPPRRGTGGSWQEVEPTPNPSQEGNRRREAESSPNENNFTTIHENSLLQIPASPRPRVYIQISSWQRQIWQGIMAIVISCGIMCCVISSQADSWWHKSSSNHNPPSARIINQASQPLVISNPADINTGELISLSYLLEEKVKFQLVGQPQIYIPPIPTGFSDLFLFYPSETLRQGLEQEYGAKIELIENLPLWKLTMF